MFSFLAISCQDINLRLFPLSTNNPLSLAAFKYLLNVFSAIPNLAACFRLLSPMNITPLGCLVLNRSVAANNLWLCKAVLDIKK